MKSRKDVREIGAFFLGVFGRMRVFWGIWGLSEFERSEFGFIGLYILNQIS